MGVFLDFAAGAPVSVADLSSQLLRVQKSQVNEILGTLVSLGLARRLRGGKYAA